MREGESKDIEMKEKEWIEIGWKRKIREKGKIIEIERGGREKTLRGRKGCG